jgi:hypothetical protein
LLHENEKCNSSKNLNYEEDDYIYEEEEEHHANDI